MLRECTSMLYFERNAPKIHRLTIHNFYIKGMIPELVTNVGNKTNASKYWRREKEVQHKIRRMRIHLILTNVLAHNSLNFWSINNSPLHSTSPSNRCDETRCPWSASSVWCALIREWIPFTTLQWNILKVRGLFQMPVLEHLLPHPFFHFSRWFFSSSVF